MLPVNQYNIICIKFNIKSDNKEKVYTETKERETLTKEMPKLLEKITQIDDEILEIKEKIKQIKALSAQDYAKNTSISVASTDKSGKIIKFNKYIENFILTFLNHRAATKGTKQSFVTAIEAIYTLKRAVVR